MAKARGFLRILFVEVFMHRREIVTTIRRALLRTFAGAAALLSQHPVCAVSEHTVTRQFTSIRTITDHPTSEFNAIAGSCIVLVQRLHDPDAGIDSWKSITICAPWMDWRVKSLKSDCLPDEDDSCISRAAPARITPQETALFRDGSRRP
jgi:hypothetical protein